MAEPWRPSGIITYTTDFGSRDPYVGIMKGVVLSRLPEARIVDLTHEVPPQNIGVGAFYVAHSWSWFPTGTVHVVVVDPGVGTERRILLVRRDGQVFLAPDNGVLAGVIGPGAEVTELDVEAVSLPVRSSTFHGRDVFSPAAASLASGTPPAACGIPLERRGGETSAWPEPERTGDFISTEVLLVDHFGNLITALVPDEREGDLAAWVVEIAGCTVPVLKTYGAASPGDLLALVDSYGHLEVAVRDGDASKRLGVGAGAALKLKRRTNP